MYWWEGRDDLTFHRSPTSASRPVSTCSHGSDRAPWGRDKKKGVSVCVEFAANPHDQSKPCGQIQSQWERAIPKDMEQEGMKMWGH
jgi:hypothetical protein